MRIRRRMSPDGDKASYVQALLIGRELGNPRGASIIDTSLIFWHSGVPLGDAIEFLEEFMTVRQMAPTEAKSFYIKRVVGRHAAGSTMGGIIYNAAFTFFYAGIPMEDAIVYMQTLAEKLLENAKIGYGANYVPTKEVRNRPSGRVIKGSPHAW
jgi:hypothetical protein